jgi:hypothetical protein
MSLADAADRAVRRFASHSLEFRLRGSDLRLETSRRINPIMQGGFTLGGSPAIKATYRVASVGGLRLALQNLAEF